MVRSLLMTAAEVAVGHQLVAGELLRVEEEEEGHRP